MRWIEFAILAALSVLNGCADPPAALDRQALWHIVHDRCLPDQRYHDRPDPCSEVDDEYVILKDRNGVAQHLLIPTRPSSGIEDPALLRPAAPNYFARAWDARFYAEARLGHFVPRDQLAITVNSAYGRSQDQLHLHIDCLANAAHDELTADAAQVGDRFSTGKFRVAGHDYYMARLTGENLSADPFKMLARDIPGASGEMGRWTLAVTGAEFGNGQPGFYLLAGRADPSRGEFASSETLQDHTCAGLAPDPTDR